MDMPRSGCWCFPIWGPNPSKSIFSVYLYVSVCLSFISLPPQSGPPLEHARLEDLLSIGIADSSHPYRSTLCGRRCAIGDLSQASGRGNWALWSSGASRAFLCPLRWAWPCSHLVPTSFLLSLMHGLSMTATWQMLSVPALFPFCITYEFDLHSRAVLISQSSSNHCILFKKYAYYYPSSGCVMTGVLKVVKRFLVAYGVMCMWYTFPDVNSCWSSLYSLCS